MKKNSEEIAKQHLDDWNDVTGFVEPETGYYFEILSVIEDAMQEYAKSQIQELREQVVEVSFSQTGCSGERERGYLEGIQRHRRFVLNLIDNLNG